MIKFNLRSKLVRSAGIYTISNIVNQAIPFLIMPVLTRCLSPTDYGVTATFQVLVGFVAPFTGLSIQGAIARKYYDKDEVDLPKYIANCLLILLISSFLVGVVFWVGAHPISNLAVFPKEWLWAVIIVSVSQFVFQVTLTIWQVQTKAVKYGIYQNLLSALNVGLSLWFVVFLGMNWQGRLWAQILAGGIAGITGLFILWQGGWIKPKFDTTYIRSSLAFGIPLIPHAFGGWIMAATDRLFINKMVSVADTGIYSVGFQLAMVVGLVETSFNTAWVPWLYEKLGEKNPETNLKIVKFTYLYVAGIFVFALGLAFFAPWFLNFFVGKDFRSAGIFIFWLALARALEAMYYMTCNYIFYSTRTGFIAFATFFSAAVHIVATYVLIKLNGTIGAAQATVVSSLGLVILVWWFAARLHKMPWLLGWSR